MYKKLRFLRKKKGYTCAEMANLMGLETKSAYSKKELGKTKISLDDAKKISLILGQDINDIFFAN